MYKAGSILVLSVHYLITQFGMLSRSEDLCGSTHYNNFATSDSLIMMLEIDDSHFMEIDGIVWSSVHVV